MNRLIVTADDFGLSLEVNEAVELAHRKGVLTAASLMVAGLAAADAVRRARRLPSLAVGLHLVLVEGPPALPPHLLAGLLGPEGNLRTDLARLGLDLALSPGLRRAMFREIEMQFEAFRATGLRLDHVNGHKHYHVHPLVSRRVVALAAHHGAGGLRVPAEPAAILRRVEPVPTDWSAGIMAPWARLLRRRARRAGLAAADRVFGLRWSGAMTPARLAGLLAELPAGISEIYTHPAVGEGFAGAAPGYLYRDELSALVSPECLELVRSRGFVTGGYTTETAESGGLAA